MLSLKAKLRDGTVRRELPRRMVIGVGDGGATIHVNGEPERWRKLRHRRQIAVTFGLPYAMPSEICGPDLPSVLPALGRAKLRPFGPSWPSFCIAAQRRSR